MVDMVTYRDIKIKYCPPNDMIGDYFNNPLNGAKLRIFEEKILNIQPYDDGSNRRRTHGTGQRRRSQPMESPLPRSFPSGTYEEFSCRKMTTGRRWYSTCVRHGRSGQG